jgi:WD40 repeat protein
LGHEGDVFSEGGLHRIQSFVFSPDSKRIVSASADGIARIWNADDRKTIGLKSQTDSELLHAIFSPDGKRVRTVSVDGTVRVWNADGSGAPVVVKGHGETIRKAIFSPKGERLLTVSTDDIVQIWPQLPLTWSELLRYLRKRTTICLTVAQRTLYLAEKQDAAERAFKACEHEFGR